jgi:hypothetical protein
MYAEFTPIDVGLRRDAYNLPVMRASDRATNDADTDARNKRLNAILLGERAVAGDWFRRVFAGETPTPPRRTTIADYRVMSVHDRRYENEPPASVLSSDE